MANQENLMNLHNQVQGTQSVNKEQRDAGK
jgi:hypothetical protein